VVGSYPLEVKVTSRFIIELIIDRIASTVYPVRLSSALRRDRNSSDITVDVDIPRLVQGVENLGVIDTSAGCVRGVYTVRKQDMTNLTDVLVRGRPPGRERPTWSPTSRKR